MSTTPYGGRPETSAMSATIRPDEWIEFGLRDPYDYEAYYNAGLDQPPRSPERDAALGILRSLFDRYGIRLVFDRVNDEERADIVREMSSSIAAAMRQPTT